jgi:DNA primase
LRQVVTAAAHHFHDLLRTHPQGQVARHYLERRGINEEIITRFQLGYAPNEWSALRDALLAQGYPVDVLLDAGLLSRNEERGTVYDRFRHRLMIPIDDVQGRVIGFGARALDDSLPKYLNSPQTPLFDKGTVLYGLDQARRAIRDANEVIIVEGYMDVLAAHQHGVANVVASMGTALTETQLRALKRYTSKFVLALDADAAGSHATIRGIQLARQALERELVPVPTASGLVRQESRLGVDVRVMTLPAGLDPDDLIRRDLDQWRARVLAAQPLVDFLFDTVAQEQDMNSAKGKAAAVRELVPLIQEVADPVERTHYVQRLARLTRVDERTVQRELDRQASLASTPAPSAGVRPAAAASTPPAVPANGAGQRPGMAEHILRAVLVQAPLLTQADLTLSDLGCEPLREADFARGEQRALLRWLRRLQTQGEGWEWTALHEDAPPFLKNYLASLAVAPSMPTVPTEDASYDLVNTILRLRQSNIQLRLQELRHLQDEARSTDAEAGNAYRQIVQSSTQELGKLQSILRQRARYIH